MGSTLPTPDRVARSATGTRGCAPSSMTNNVIYEKNVIYAGEVIYDAGSNLAYPRTAWRAAPSRDPGSSVKIAAKRHRIFLKSWIPDLRAGEPALVRDTSLCTVTYGGNVIYACGRPSRRARAIGVETSRENHRGGRITIG